MLIRLLATQTNTRRGVVSRVPGSNSRPTCRGHQERRLGGVTQDRPAAAVALGRQEPRVVAERRRGEQEDEVGLVTRPHAAVRRDELPLRTVPIAAGLEFLPAGPQPQDRHLVLGQGAGLVGAYDRRTAQRLDGGEALDQRIAAGHALHAHGQ